MVRRSPGLQDSWLLSPADYRESAESAVQRGVVSSIEFEDIDNLALWPARVAEGVGSLRGEASVWPRPSMPRSPRGAHW